MKAIFTVLTGNYDRMRPPMRTDKDVLYFAFTDRTDYQLPAPWKMIHVDALEGPTHLSRYYKTNLFTVCHLIQRKIGFDFRNQITSLMYIDANFQQRDYFEPLFEAHEASKCAVTIARHPHRQCIHEELLAQHSEGKISHAQLQVLQARYADGLKIPANIGLYACGMYIASVNPASEAFDLFTHWWQMIQRQIVSFRDQVPFAVVAHYRSLFAPHLINAVPTDFFLGRMERHKHEVNE